MMNIYTNYMNLSRVWTGMKSTAAKGMTLRG